MDENRRQHPRHPIKINIKISNPEMGEKIVKTRDVSDSGVFIIAEPSDMPSPGEIVEGQVQGMVDDPPLIKMEIVRLEDDGLGLKYIDE